MSSTGRSRPKARRSRQRMSQRQRRRRRLDHHAVPPKRIIRLYRNSRIDLLPHKDEDMAQGLPHPRPHALAGKMAMVSKSKHIQHHEVSDIPLPIAATAAKEAAAYGYDMLNIAANLTEISPKASAVHATSSIKVPPIASFSPLPPLPSLVITQSVDYHQTRGTSNATTSISTPTPVSQTSGQESTKMAVPLIVLLSVGVGCIVLGLYLLFKFFTRPRRTGRIVPSLPILEKAYTYDAENDACGQGGKESPVFGGKERSASHLGSGGPLWTWVQYSKPSDVKEPAPHSGPESEPSDELPLPLSKEFSIKQTPPVNRRDSAVLPPAADLAPRKRMSTVSLYHDRESKDFGLAITGDGYPILERSRSKLARRSKSYSMSADRRTRDSGYRPDSAYGGADVSSPTTYFQPVTTPTINANPGPGTEGRARIQSSYYAVAPYPRLSSLPMSYSIGTARKVHLSKAYATERRDPEEATFTHAVDSSYPSSPNPTLYPDDSMSVMAATRHKRRSQYEHHRASRNLGVNSGNMKGLLEMEFGVSRMSLSDLAETPTKANEKFTTFQSNMATSESRVGLNSGRSQDKPPRVPSPPPLPSLAQMALAHSNTEAYSNYRSPTYSIYGLYGSDRKSSAPNVE